MPFTESSPLLWGEDETRQSYYRSRVSNRLPFWRQDEEAAQPGPQQASSHKDLKGNNPHAQFCALVGCPPSNAAKGSKFEVQKNSLYGRVTKLLSTQRRAYNFSASLSNTLLLAQVILGAALTALGASASSHVLITVFGATNTIIAGLVAYLKSRGQPMRARMYRDDLERIFDEIENSEVMWRGISEGVHGYEDIDTDEVTVRSEVARLTRLYERAVRLNGMNNPDMYMAGGGQFDGNVRGSPRPNRGQVPGQILPVVSQTAPQPSADNNGPSVPAVAASEDAAPATQVIKEEKKDQSKVEGKKPATDGNSDDVEGKTSDPSSSNQPVVKQEPTSTQSSDSAATTTTTPNPDPPAPSTEDPDASPATAAKMKSKRNKSDTGKADGKGGNTKVAGDDEEQ